MTASTPLLEIDRALAIVLDHAPALGSERVAVAEADGRYLAEAVTAATDLPPFTNSAMDGYALRDADTPGRLTVAGESAAGRPYGATVGPGETVSISTGAVLPAGATAIVPIEDVLAAPAPELIEVPRIGAGANVRPAGGDAEAGTVVLEAGTRMAPAGLAAAISAGAAHVCCGLRPRVAIVTTGDELRPPGARLEPGQIHDSNGPMLSALATRSGASVTVIAAAADTAAAHAEALGAALEHDVVLSTGGVSVGRHDLVREIGGRLGVRELFWRVKMRPGKPLSFGVRDTTLVFGIPGNPVSVLVCFELFVAPALARLQGATHPGPAFGRGRLATAVRRNPERDNLIRVIHDASGALRPLEGQGSHQIAYSAQANGLARIATGEGELAAGSDVPFLPLAGT